MLKRRYVLLMAVIALSVSCTRSLPFVTTSDQHRYKDAAAPWLNEDYRVVLRRYVNAKGLVDYAALQANPQPLNAAVTSLATVAPDTYRAWSDAEKIAFLINAYNAITLATIVEQQPLRASIKDIWGAWNFKRHTVIGQSVTLDMIEHEMLRKRFQEPRIHAALVCAAISCPPLRQEPYTGTRLDDQLDDQVSQWLSSHGLQIDRAQKQVSISAIFDWFGDDWRSQYETNEGFVGSAKERATLNFVSRYVSPQDRDYLRKGKYKLSYLNYDWSLNRQE